MVWISFCFSVPLPLPVFEVSPLKPQICLYLAGQLLTYLADWSEPWHWICGDHVLLWLMFLCAAPCPEGAKPVLFTRCWSFLIGKKAPEEQPISAGTFLIKSHVQCLPVDAVLYLGFGSLLLLSQHSFTVNKITCLFTDLCPGPVHVSEEAFWILTLLNVIESGLQGVQGRQSLSRRFHGHKNSSGTLSPQLLYFTLLSVFFWESKRGAIVLDVK